MNNSLKHIAIIMDGNRRWARAHKLAIIKGHRKAAHEALEPLADAAIRHNIAYITLWAFSTENWKRDAQEVAGLMQLFRESLAENIGKLHKKGVRVQTIGDLSKFPEDIQQQVAKGAEETKNNTRLTLTIALNYGGRDEILRAVHRLRMTNDKLPITEHNFHSYLDTSGMPDPDMIIRTGGEKRLSGFLPWQSVYSELYFTDVLFPDFSPEEFDKAVAEYYRRNRRFGK